MTSKAPVWEPPDTGFADQEDAMADFRGKVIRSDTIVRVRWIINSLSISEDDALDFTGDDNLYNALKAKVNVDRVGASKGRHGVTSESVSNKLLISPEPERRKVQHTTQRWIRMIIHPSLSHQFKTNKRVMRYNRLQHNVFAVIM